ncbi:MAG: hypothetical protein HY242_10435 [Afipia sp.]|nr:hypothetical protein [Afipia sp.]
MVFAPLHWFFFIAVVVAVVYPIGRVLARLGFSPLWSLLVFVPLVNLAALWVLAHIDWPDRKGRR